MCIRDSTYTDGGLYDVGLTIDAGGDSYARTRRHYIVVLADTLMANSVELVPAQDIEVVISSTNATPLGEITIPVEFSGSLDLQYDSFSVAGCRTETFDNNRLTHYSPATKRFTVQLGASADGYPGVQPGSGPLLKLYFHINGLPILGGYVEIVLDGYYTPGHDRLPVFSGIFADYQPATSAGLVFNGDCCDLRGDIDNSGAPPIDIADLVYLVDFMFNGGPPPMCFDEGDVDASDVEPIDIADLVYLVDFMFNSGPAPPPCP